MAGTQTSLEAMESTASKCQNLGEEIAGKLQNLMVQLEPMDQDLQGKAGMTFKEVKNTINTEVTNINRVLDDMAVAIRTSGQDMDASDQQSDSSLRNATADIEGTTASNQLTGGQA